MGRFPIPNDWTEEDGYKVVFFCIPDSNGWRTIITGMIESLSWGWSWNEKTGIITDVQGVGRDIFESMCMMDCVDFKRIADALWIEVNEQEKSITQVLYDSSQASGLSFDDLIDELGNSVEDANDLFELFTHIKNILPGLPGLPALSVLAIWRAMQEARYRHSDLTLKAYMATSARHIGNALAPITEDEGTTEEDNVNDVLGQVAKIPWLTTAIVSLVDPSPAGEITFVVKMALTAKSLYDKAVGVWAEFRDKYINQVGDPQPVSSVVGQLAEIAARLSNAGGNINVNVSDCEGCEPEVGGGASAGTPEPDYQCEAGKWYIGVVIDRLWALINLQYVEDAPNDIQDTQEQWVTGAVSDILDFLNDRASIFTGEIIQNNENEAVYPISEPSTTFINDWGREFALSQNDINSLYELLNNGIVRVETGQIYNPVRDDYIDVPVDVVYHLNAMEYLTNILDHQQDILDAFTSATTASEARQNLVDVFEADISPPFLDGGVEYKPARRKLTDLITGQGVVNRIFSTDVSETEIDLVSWRVTAECPDGDLNLSCLQSLIQAYGTPLIDEFGNPNEWDIDTYPVGTWITITSEFQNDGFPVGQNYEVVSFQDFDSDYSMEAEILFIPDGFSLDVYMADCDGETYSQNHSSAGSLGTFKTHILALSTVPKQASSPGSFQIRLRRLT